MGVPQRSCARANVDPAIACDRRLAKESSGRQRLVGALDRLEALRGFLLRDGTEALVRIGVELAHELAMSLPDLLLAW